MRAHRLRKTGANGARTSHASVRKGAGLRLPKSRGLRNAEPLSFGKGQASCWGRSQVPSPPNRSGPWPWEVPTPDPNARTETPAVREDGASGPPEGGLTPLGGFTRRREGAMVRQRVVRQSWPRPECCRRCLGEGRGLVFRDSRPGGIARGGAKRQGAGPAPRPGLRRWRTARLARLCPGRPRGGASRRPLRRWERSGRLCW